MVFDHCTGNARARKFGLASLPSLRYPDSARMNLRRGWGPEREPIGSAQKVNFLTGSSLVLAVLQSVCTAVFTISGIRLAIGLTAFALAGSVSAPIRWFHQDAIRHPHAGSCDRWSHADLADFRLDAALARPACRPMARREKAAGKNIPSAFRSPCHLNAVSCRFGNLDAHHPGRTAPRLMRPYRRI